MPRFFFDVHDDIATFDNEGLELPNEEAVKLQAIAILPKIAADEMLLSSGDRRHYTVLVTDEKRQPIYSATLTYTGAWLKR